MAWIATTRSLARDAANGTLSLQEALTKALAVPDDAATWHKIGASVCQW